MSKFKSTCKCKFLYSYIIKLNGVQHWIILYNLNKINKHICHNEIRVTIQAIITGRTLARNSILPKWSRFWLFALCRSIVVWYYITKLIESKVDCAYLHRFDRSHLLTRNTPQLVDYVQYLHVIGQTTLDVLGHIKSRPRRVPYKWYIWPH